MPGKILWLTAWVTLAVWLGSAFGCATTGDHDAGEQNYKALEAQPRDINETRLDPDEPGAALSPASGTLVFAAPAEASMTDAQWTDEHAGAASTTGAHETADAPLIDMSRSNWHPVEFAAADGRSPNWERFYWPVPTDRFRDELAIADATSIDDQIEAALDGAYAQGASKANLIDAVAQPLKFGVDTVLFPFSLIAQPTAYWDTPKTSAAMVGLPEPASSDSTADKYRIDDDSPESAEAAVEADESMRPEVEADSDADADADANADAE